MNKEIKTDLLEYLTDIESYAVSIGRLIREIGSKTSSELVNDDLCAEIRNSLDKRKAKFKMGEVYLVLFEANSMIHSSIVHNNLQMEPDHGTD